MRSENNGAELVATNVSIRQQSPNDSSMPIYEYSDEDSSHEQDPAPVAGGSMDPPQTTSVRVVVPHNSTPVRPRSRLLRGTLRQNQNAVRRVLSEAALEQLAQKQMKVRLDTLYAKLRVRRELGLHPDTSIIPDDIMEAITNLQHS